jgi:hypothetical protein
MTNETGVDWAEVHISPSDENEWGDDILDGAGLEDGDEFAIEWEPGSSCDVDIKITDDDGEVRTIEEFDFCKNHNITIYMNGERIAYRAS